jgi:hypothetical protein
VPIVGSSEVGEATAIAGLCLLIAGLLSLSRYITDKAEGRLRAMVPYAKREARQEPPGPPL